MKNESTFETGILALKEEYEKRIQDAQRGMDLYRKHSNSSADYEYWLGKYAAYKESLKLLEELLK